MLGGVGSLVSIGLAGCADHGWGECYGDCSKVQSLSIDSQSGIGENYTIIIVLFEKPFTGTVEARTYMGNDDVTGVKEVEVKGAEHVEIKFDRYTTGGKYKVFLEEN